MSKQNLKKRYRQSAIIEGARAKHPTIEIEMDNGEVFEVDAPQFWPDAATDPEVGPLESARQIMGEKWDPFVAAGGSMSLLNLVVEQYGEDNKVTSGGIFSLLIFLREYREAAEYDLLKLGLDLDDLGSPGLPWRRAVSVCKQLARDKTTSVYRQANGEWVDWDLQTQVLVGSYNALRTLAWQNTKDATERNPKHRPEPLLPPGVELDDENRQTEKFGGNAHMTIEEADEWLGW